MSTFVLIAGAWHGAWCWQRVAPLLQAAGHQVRTPELLGMGEDNTPLAEVSLGGWADPTAPPFWTTSPRRTLTVRPCCRRTRMAPPPCSIHS